MKLHRSAKKEDNVDGGGDEDEGDTNKMTLKKESHSPASLGLVFAGSRYWVIQHCYYME